MAFLPDVPALSPGGDEREAAGAISVWLLPSKFGVLQADLDVLMHKQPSLCHALTGTFQLAPTKAA